MLDEHAGGQRVYHVLNAVIGGSPMGRWIAAPESEDYQETYGAMLRDFFGPNARLRGDLPAPTVAIIQQSLQRTPTPETRLGPVHDLDDPMGHDLEFYREQIPLLTRCIDNLIDHLRQPR